MHNQRIIMTNNVRLGSATPLPQKPSFFTRSMGYLGAIANPFSDRLPDEPSNWVPGDSARWTFSSSPPTDTLNRIKVAAQKGLNNAETIEVPLGQSSAPALHGKIEARLMELKKQTKEKTDKAAQQGQPVAGAADPLMTRPVSFEDRNLAKVQNAKALIPIQRERLCKKITALTVLMQMLNQCGKEEKDFAEILRLVKNATDTRQSIWDLFVAKYNPSLKEQMEAGAIYWLYYKSGLVEKGINAYVGDLIDTVVDVLADPKEAVLAPLLRSILENTDDFLVEDRKATEEFGNQVGSGSLKERREKAIRQKYDFSEEDLCKRCSEAIMRKLSPRIPIFEELHNVRVIGWIFKKFSAIVNRFIIQKAMNSFILPMIFKKGLDKGLELTHPDYLPFKINITRFLKDQLSALQVNDGKKKQPASNEGSKRFPGTERLPTMAANLVAVLNLEEDETAEPPILGTPAAIKARMQKSSLLNSQIIPKFEGSIVDSCHLLFAHLSKTAQNGELFSQLLDLSIRSFEPPTTTTTNLQAQLDVEKQNLDEIVDAVVDKIIAEKVEELFEGPNPESSRELAASSFKKQQIATEEAINALNAVCSQIGEKVENASQAPLTNDTQPEIVSSLQILQALASRKELKDPLNNVKSTDQAAIWDVLNPIFEKVEEVEKRLLTLQKLQLNYSANAQVVSSYEEIHRSLSGIEKELNESPRHFRLAPDATEELLQKVKKFLGNEAPAYKKGTELIAAIHPLLAPITQEQETIDALQDCRAWANQVLAGNDPKGHLQKINRHLNFLSENEKEELETLKGPKGRDLLANREAFKKAIERMIQAHKTIQTQKRPAFQAALQAAITWTKETADNFEALSKTDYTALQEEKQRLLSDMSNLHQQTQSLKLSLSDPSYFSNLKDIPVTLVKKAAKPALESHINKLAKDLFKKSYAFIFKERIYKVMFTRTMLELSKLK